MTAPEPYWSDGQVSLHLGDCLDVLAEMDADSVDAVITDPPYGLEFMSVAWDTFSDRPKGSARPRNEWGDFGSREHARHPSEVATIRRKKGLAYYEFSLPWTRECLRVLKPGAFMLAFGGTRTWHRLSCAIEDVGFEIQENVSDLTGIDGPGLMWVHGQGFPKTPNALKPSWEPIVVARKPLAGTVAANVAAYGTGALNIKACRVEPTGESRPRNGEASQETRYADNGGTDFAALPGIRGGDPAGRWPPNVALGSEAAAELDRQSGVLTSGANPTRRNSDVFSRDVYGDFQGQRECVAHRGADSGGASRFFPVFRYEAKAASYERPKNDDGSGHPTVKPLELMRWLVRLVTPPGGLVADFFAGSGTTGEACVIEGFPCLLVEKDPASVNLIRKRLDKPIQPVLFGGVA